MRAMPGVTESRELRYLRYLHLVRCPRCTKSSLEYQDRVEGTLYCSVCTATYPIVDEIPRLFWEPENSREDNVTHRIQRFYEQNPFPGYEEFDDLAALVEKAREGHFARLLDEQIPFGVRVLECGCGTGQLSNFLGIAHRTVFGTDLALNSLSMAEKFRHTHQLDRVFFLQMNLFFPAFPPASFDYVICNGVLHHTAQPFSGFQQLVRLVRPGGYLIVGLYHRFGRIPTDLRRLLFRLTGERLQFLDPRIRKVALGKQRRRAWYADQYQNPHESKHTISEIISWLDRSGCELVRTIPRTRLLDSPSKSEKLFEPERSGGRWERALVEFGQTFSRSAEGGFFTVIARRRH